MLKPVTNVRIHGPASPWRLDHRMVLAGALYYWRVATLIFAAVVLAGTLWAFLMPGKYRSEARLLALTSDYYDVRTNMADGPGAKAFDPDEVVNVEMQLLSSEDLHRAALIRSGFDARNPALLEKARAHFSQSLTIARIDGANVITLNFSDHDPRKAASSLQNLLRVYFETRARVLTSGRVALLSREREAAKADLARYSAALQSFQVKSGIADIDAQIEGAVQIDTDLRQKLAQSTADLSRVATSLGRLRSTISKVPNTVELYRDDTEATRAISEMQAQILQLLAKRADLSGRYMEGSPLIQQVDKQIAGLRTAIDTQAGLLKDATRIGRNSYYDAAIDQLRAGDASVSGEMARKTQLSREVASSAQRLANFNAVAGTIRNLQIQREAAAERFRLLSIQVEQARARETEASTGSTNVRTIQKPNIPSEQTNSRLLMIAGSLFAGMALAAAALFLLITGRDVMIHEEEASLALAAPVLGDLREPAIAGRSGLRPLRRQIETTAFHDSGTGHVIAIVGTSARDISASLGRIRSLLEEDRGPVATVLFEEIAYALSRRQLLHGIGGQAAANSITVGSVAWTIEATGEKLLDSLRTHYRWTLLLVPPILSDSDVRDRLGIAVAADVIVMIAQMEKTPRRTAIEIANSLTALGNPLQGVILTGKRLNLPLFLRRWMQSAPGKVAVGAAKRQEQLIS